MPLPDRIRIDSLTDPFYTGSVQCLHALPDCPAHMVSETTNRGSVFDVGSIFDIPGSDVARAVFRHALYSRLASPAFWETIRNSLESDRTLPQPYRYWLLEGALEQLLIRGGKTHHEGMLEADTGILVRDGAPSRPSRFNVVRRYQILKPRPFQLLGNQLFDYSGYSGSDGFVIPLEIIVRFGVTQASSVYRRYQALAADDQTAYARELGVSSKLVPWEVLETPISDCTTKFEPEDRNLSKQEALAISGLSGDQFAHALKLSVLGSWAVRHLLCGLGLQLWDIKWEFAKDRDDIVFVDTIDTDSFRATRFLDTPDGQRLVIHFNKQSLRDAYTLLHPDWFRAVHDAKTRAKVEHVPFPELLARGQAQGIYPETPALPAEFLQLQERKMTVIQGFMLNSMAGPEAEIQLGKLATAELQFYETRGLEKEFRRKNGVDR